MTNPKISIIVPIYNLKDYLIKTLNSVQEQTLVNWECLLIDDGSTDGSGEICDEFAANDSRFIVFHISNGGQNRARNIGLKNAKGDYIAFLDGDDRYPSYALEEMYNCIISNDCDFLAGMRKPIFKDDNVNEEELLNFKIDKGLNKHLFSPFSQKDINAKLLWNMEWFMTAPGNLAKKSLYKTFCFNEKLNYGEDQVLIKELFFNTRKCIILPKCIYLYVQRADSLTHKRNAHAVDIIQSFYEMAKVLEKYNAYDRYYYYCYIIYFRWIKVHWIYHSKIDGFKEYCRKFQEFICTRDKAKIPRKYEKFFARIQNPITFWCVVAFPVYLEIISLEHNFNKEYNHLKSHFKRLFKFNLNSLLEIFIIPFWLCRCLLKIVLNKKKVNIFI